MLRTMRNIHLCAAMFSLAFLAMYTISAIQMAHSRWFDIRPRVTERNVALAPGMTDGRAAARELIANHGVRGELRSIEPGATGLRLRIVRPGTVYEARYAAATGVTVLKSSTSGWLGMLNRLHHSEGLWHEYRPANIWALFAGIVSVGLFVLGTSGLYLWFANQRERWIGATIAAIAAAAALPLIVSMRWY